MKLSVNSACVFTVSRCDAEWLFTLRSLEIKKDKPENGT